MTIRTQLTVLVLLAAGVAGEAFADCTGGSSVPLVQEAYAAGQAQERAGKLKEALSSYLEAQAYICDTKNPIELPAARRAAQVAKPLGASEEKKGNLEEAFAAYESGGLYADADRVMIANARAHADDPGHVQTALTHFYRREEGLGPYSVRLSVTGPYTANPGMEPELLAMADKGVERALQREAAAFNESYLRERVQLIQARPDDVTDYQARDATIQRETAFAKKWPEDLLKKSRAELSKVLAWSRVIRAPDVDAGREEKIAGRAEKRALERAATLTQSYSGAPQFLADAVEYRSCRFEDTACKSWIQQVRAQAMKLGDEASAKGRLGLAHDYYEAADDRDKAMAAQNRQNELAKKKLQPKIDEATKQAEALKAGFGSPAEIAAMKKQAQESSKAMQEQKLDKKERKKKADDLASELGM
jgi:hypothetical protein